MIQQHAIWLKICFLFIQFHYFACFVGLIPKEIIALKIENTCRLIIINYNKIPRSKKYVCAQFLKNCRYAKNWKNKILLRKLQVNTVARLYWDCRLCKNGMNLSKIDIKTFLLLLKITSQHSNKATNLIIREKWNAILKRLPPIPHENAAVIHVASDRQQICTFLIVIYFTFMLSFRLHSVSYNFCSWYGIAK
jgi:hypothetical protein